MTVTFDEWCSDLADRLARNQQRLTPQRRLIAEVLFGQSGHVNADELHQLVRERDRSVGYATVYRMLKLLDDHDLVHSNTFVDGTARYEVASEHDDHHDHLVCRDCGHITEFENDEIERLQDVVAKRLGFELVDHAMVLYGRCQTTDCPHKKRRKPR